MSSEKPISANEFETSRPPKEVKSEPEPEPEVLTTRPLNEPTSEKEFKISLPPNQLFSVYDIFEQIAKSASSIICYGERVWESDEAHCHLGTFENRDSLRQ